MSLVQLVGGIQAAKKIVEGAPDGTDYYAIVEELYYKSGMPFMVWAGTAWVPDSCVTRVQNILAPAKISELLENIEQKKQIDILLADGKAILEWVEDQGHD